MIYLFTREGLAHTVFMANPLKGGGAKLQGLNAERRMAASYHQKVKVLMANPSKGGDAKLQGLSAKAYGSQLPSGRRVGTGSSATGTL